MTVALEIAFILFLVVLNGCFAMSELAIVSSRRARLAALAADGSKGAKAALALADDPSRFLSSVQIGITLVGILAGAYSGATLAEQLAGWLVIKLPIIAPAAEAVSIAIVVGAITYGSLIVGELVPKQIALSNPERMAVLVARPMTLVARFAAPLVWVLEGSSRLALRLLRVRKSDDQAVTEEEVKAMIAEGTESGVFEPQEKEMIAAVMRLGDRKVRALMTPRNQVRWIDPGWERERIARQLRESRHSRLPVCHGDFDEVLGVVQAKDLLDGLLADNRLDIEAAVKPIIVVHDNSPAFMILEAIRKSEVHMALVVDEYGSVEGIVTASDILSAIVGGLDGIDGHSEPGIFQREDGSWLIDGDIPADLAAERLGCRFLTDRESNYSTMAGFFLARSRQIPATGDRLEWEGWRFEVVDMDGRRIDKLLVSPPDAKDG